MKLERDPQAPSLARAAVRGFSEQRRMSPEALATLALLVSELVSNAVLHSDAPASSEIRLRAQLLDADAVRVEVTDQGSGFHATPRGPDRPGGYGLFLVDRQASRWGIELRRGTCVWFELASD